MKILFIGNSYTYVNNLPATVAWLGGTSGSKWKMATYLRGGASLRTHFCDNYGIATERGIYCEELDADRIGLLDSLLTSEQWEVVILQGQSMETLQTPNDFLAYGKVLADRVRAAGCPRIVLYQTWARQHFPEMQAVISIRYNELAAATTAEVARVGEAWARALQLRPQLLLHSDDRSHPAASGSYLAACVLYSQLTGEAAADGAPGIPEIKGENGEKSYYNFDEETAAFLRQVADRGQTATMN